MTRETVRRLKRGARPSSVRGASETDVKLNQDCALALLTRSIHFSHGRLAVLRLSMAIDAGAAVPTEHWLYCSEVARSSGDVQLQALYRSAAIRASKCTQQTVNSFNKQTAERHHE
jgi:hypothetical protein